MHESSPDPQIEYARRLELRRIEVARCEAQHRRIGNLRLTVFVAVAAMAWFVLFRSHSFSQWWLLVPAGVFIALVLLHGRVLKRRERARRAAAYYERGTARLQGRWQGTGNPGDRFLDASHPYAQDLDLFGKGSLFELLCSARTHAGEEKLAAWLLAGSGAEDIRGRQPAVAELRPKLDLREELYLLGEEVEQGVNSEALVAWGSAPAVLDPRPVFLSAITIALLTLASLAIWGASGNHHWFLLMLFIVLIFRYALRTAVRRIVGAVDRPGRDLELLHETLRRFEREKFTSPRMTALQGIVKVKGKPPSARIARLNKLTVLLDSRRNLLFAPVAAILLWEILFACAIEAWRRDTGPAVAGWLAALGEFEALSALAGYAYEHPHDPFPEITDGGACFVAEMMGHPLLQENDCVRNDVALGGELRVLIVSGSNMSGKSTLLRTVGTNAVLALAGAPVRARSLRLSPLALGASIRTLDSLMEGSSRFYAEISRLRKLVDLAGGPVPLLFLLDELLHGTNSHDRRIGGEAVVAGLVRRGSIGLLTTHDLALADMIQTLGSRAANVHFEDHLENGRMAFDYRLHPGIVHKSNALELMRSIGLEV